MPMRAPRKPSKNAGTGLIEVMATITVLTFGMLGIAAVQIQSKRSNYEAIQRTAASMLAHEIIERMRTNTGQLETYLEQGVALGGGYIVSEPTPQCSSESPCSTFELAVHDLWEWEQALDGAQETRSGQDQGGLVAPTACITGPIGGGSGTYAVAIAWRGQTQMANPSTDACGAGTGKYDEGGDTDVYRRVLIVDTFIDAG